MSMSAAEYGQFRQDMKHVHHGALHRALGVPQDQPIPAAKLREAKRSKDAHIRKMANLAEAFRGMKHGKGKKG